MHLKMKAVETRMNKIKKEKEKKTGKKRRKSCLKMYTSAYTLISCTHSVELKLGNTVSKMR